ncbi:MAG: 4Fe-4S binding protein [Acidobacteriota bacterium]
MVEAKSSQNPALRLEASSRGAAVLDLPEEVPATPVHPAPSVAGSRPKKKLIRRRQADRSQALRRAFQVAFLLLNLWIGVEFYLFVRHYELGGTGPYPSRPGGIAGWLPIAGLMNLKYFLLTGVVPKIHAPAMYLLVAFLLVSLAWSKSFCSWLCPVGTLSEALWKAGRKLFKRNWRLPRWLDLPLRSLKYLLLALFLYAVGSMPPAAIAAFMQGPYGLVADVKMLNFFRYLSQTAAVVIVALVVLSIFIQNFWCRYLCPYGALMGLAAVFSPAKIRRNAEVCIDCAKCAKACPALLPVDNRAVIRSLECTSCLECVAVCPAQGALHFGGSRRKALAPRWVAAGIAAVFLAIVIYAKWAGHWESPIPDELNRQLIPRAQEFGHP